MEVIVRLYSIKQNEINRFLSHLFNNTTSDATTFQWQKKYNNPIEIADIIGIYIENIDDYQITMWISLDTRSFYKSYT